MRRGCQGMLLWFAGVACFSSPRDPFRPVQEHCAVQWQGWRYGGSVTGESGSVAIIQSPDLRWHRLMAGEQVVAGWQITDISPVGAVLRHDGACGRYPLTMAAEAISNGRE